MSAAPLSPSKLSVAMSWEDHRLQRTIRCIDGRWEYRSFSSPEIRAWLGGGQGFQEHDKEVMHYTTQVVVDMLNEGDIEPSTGHLQAVRAAIQPCGKGLGLDGAWGSQLFVDIPPWNIPIYILAWLRCGRYLIQETEAGSIPSGRDDWDASVVRNDWWPYSEIKPELLAWAETHEDGDETFRGDYREWLTVEQRKSWDGYYMGRDGRILHRIAAIEIGGDNIFDLDFRAGAQSVAKEIARIVLAGDPSERLSEQAQHYLDTSDQIRHYHCDTYDCKAKHRKETTRCAGIIARIGTFPCKEGYPCLLTDPSGFDRRFAW